MDVLVEIDDGALLQLLLMAKRHHRSLDEEMLEILERAARPEKIRARGKQHAKAESRKSEQKGLL